MDLDSLQARLIAAARCAPPDDRVPYAFERRVMARLRQAAPMDALGLWGHALWRGAIPCVVLAALLSAWSLWEPAGTSLSGDYPNDFETVVLAAADQSSDAW
jgi:hypothetical protein